MKKIAAEPLAEGWKTMIVVNLESGMPTVGRAMIQLRQTLLTAKSRRTDVIKLIHGYGSTGRGGAIRSAVRRELNLRAEAGEIRCYICGEDFSPFDESSRWAIARYPYLCRDQDYARINHGITIVVL